MIPHTARGAMPRILAPLPIGGPIGSSIIGQTLFESGESFYGPWFSAPSDGAVFTCDAIAVKSSFLRFYVVVQTKNSGESDAAATTAVAFGAISSIGRATATATGLKQLVRYKYTVNSDPLTGVEWVHFRMLGPTWLWN